VGFVLRRPNVKVGELMDNPGTLIDRMDPAGDELRFRADALMPAQFFPARLGCGRADHASDVAILIDAVRFKRNFEAHNPSRQRKFRKAQSWIFDDIENEPLAFEEVCDTLGIG
jgi:hypothetical protein